MNSWSGIQSIETFGTVSGRLTDPFADRKAILAEVGLDEARWAEQVRAFREALAAAKSDPALFRRYQQAYEAARDAGRPAPPRAAPTPSPVLPAPPALDPPATSPAQPYAVPSYKLPSAKPVTPQPSFMLGQPPAPPQAQPQPPPPRPAVSPISDATAQVRPSAPKPLVGSSTEGVDLRIVEQGIALAKARQAGGAAPQGAPPGGNSPPSPASSPMPRVPTGTTAVDASAVEQGLALAAQRGRVVPAPGSQHPGSATVLASPSPSSGSQLPFKPSSNAAPRVPPPTGTPVERFASGTILADVDASRGPATPFVSSDGSPAPRSAMNVKQYAFVFVALRDASPAELPAVLARFGLTPTTRAELDADWKARMKADTSLSMQFGVALAGLKKQR